MSAPRTLKRGDRVRVSGFRVNAGQVGRYQYASEGWCVVSFAGQLVPSNYRRSELRALPRRKKGTKP